MKFTQKADVNNNLFSFQVDDQSYTLYFIPDPTTYPNLVPTIFGGTTILKENSFFLLTKNLDTVFTILQTQPLLAGSKIISGTINAITANVRVNNNATIFSVILLSESETPVGITRTDVEGNYEFRNLPEGKYKIVVAFELDQPQTSNVTVVDVTLHNAKVDFSLSSGAILPTQKILQLEQNITFEKILAKEYGDASFILNAVSDSNLPVTYSSSNPNVAKIINSNEVVIVGAGNTVIEVSQTGNEDYFAAPITSQELIVNKANQVLIFQEIPIKSTTDLSFVLEVESNSALPITISSSNEDIATISGDTVNILNPGLVQITASQAGDENHLAANAISRDLQIELVTGIESELDDLIIYPNPVDNVLHFSSAHVVTIIVTDLAGRREKFVIEDLSVNLSKLEAGLYFINFMTNTESRLFKVVKN